MENSIPDPRVDELLDLVEQIFALYSRLWYDAAIGEKGEFTNERGGGVSERRRIGGIDLRQGRSRGSRHISGAEELAAAERVAVALAAWHKAGEAAGQVAFWRPQVEEFDSPQAFGRVIEVLLDRSDLPAAMALLMHWLGQADTVRLDGGRFGFYTAAIRWLQIALSGTATSSNEAAGEDRAEIDGGLVKKFFDYLEANAEPLWEVPEWQPGELANESSSGRKLEGTADAEDDEFADEEGDEEDDIFSAAYENMVFRDSTADDIDADMLEVPGMGDQGNDELERELRRLSPRLAFLAMLAEQWKMVAWSEGSGRGEGGRGKAEGRFEIPEGWREQARVNRQGLMKLAAAVQRHPVVLSSAGFDALVEYDRRRLTREMLLEKVVATLAATMQAKILLEAVGSAAGTQETIETAGGETSSGEAGGSETASSETEVAIGGPRTSAMMALLIHADTAGVRKEWGGFLAEIAKQPLLYVPLSRGGDARKIAAARTVQQTLREMLRYLPRLGLVRETCQLLRVARAMEKDHPPGPGAVTEFDRLFEIGYQGIVESLVESSLDWNRDRPFGEEAPAKQAEYSDSDPTADVQLIDCLQQVTESLLSEWLSHSRTLRLSVMERVGAEKPWQELVKFIERYGHDLFTQQFFHLGNLRAILHQGVDVWLDRLVEDDSAAEQFLLVRELDHGLSRAEAKKHLSLVIEAIVENYGEYRDYNATTTQSDRGEMLYTLLDFLRVKVAYERIHWNLRPVIMAHEVLIRRGMSSAAELWRRAMAHRTGDVADQQLARLAKLQAQYGMRISSIADRLGERFVRPLVIDRVRSLVEPAAEEAHRGESSTAFALLEDEAGQLADEPSGAGLDVPDWLETLAKEVERRVGQIASLGYGRRAGRGLSVAAIELGRSANATSGLE